jgi:hypothetical protein
MSRGCSRKIREKRGLCYSVYAFHWAFADSGMFGVAASTGEEEVERSDPGRRRRTAQRATETITDEEVIRVREPDSRRSPDVARKPVVAGRPAGAPADPLGPHHSAAGDGRAHQPHHRRSRQAGRPPDVLVPGEASLAGIGPVASLPDYKAITAQLKN